MHRIAATRTPYEMAGDPHKTAPLRVDEHDKFVVPQNHGFHRDRKSRSDFAPEAAPRYTPAIVIPEEAGLQVDHGHWGKALLEVDTEQPKYVVDFNNDTGAGIEVAPEGPAEKKERLIFGFRRRTFWVIFGVLVLVILGGAVGGGVGGGIAVKNKNEAAAAASQV